MIEKLRIALVYMLLWLGISYVFALVLFPFYMAYEMTR